MHRLSRIMMVDDESTNLKLLTKTLQAHGFKDLEPIQDSREVINSYNKTRPDLILLDLNMPHLSGFDILDKLAALEDPLLPPVVVLTAQKGQDYFLQAFEKGARDYITKPFDMSELLARVNNMLEVRTAHRIVHEEKEYLDELVRQRSEELLQTRLQVVQRLGRAAEYRDNETGKHIMRVSHTAVLLAGELGWDKKNCETLLHATPMHDIGKIGIPDSILLKPGKLDQDEWEIMKTHAAIGSKILEGDDSDLLKIAGEIAISHHERWDGGGYPWGLSGEEIPVSGRIVSIADVFDALTSKRSYKEAWTAEDAYNLIVENGGLQFDPGLIKIFQANFGGIMEIQNRFTE